MGECVLTFERIELLNKKSDTNHSDNDWLSMVWAINDQSYMKTVPLVNTAGSNILDSGDVLLPFQDYVVCQGMDTVTVVYSIINLGSYDFGKQAEVASQFTKSMLDVVAPIYLQAAEVVLGVVATAGFGAPEAIAELAGISGPLAGQLSSKIGGLIDSAFDDVVTPFLGSLVEFVTGLLGVPNCNGEVLHDYVIFLPNQPEQDVRISKIYEGPQRNSSCGHAPETKVDILMHREGIVLPQANWRLCSKCQELFYDGDVLKGSCPAGGVQVIGSSMGRADRASGVRLVKDGHSAGGYNFVLPHDVPGPGQAEWRYCKKCHAMFYNGFSEKGVCPAGGAHQASGYNFVLPHSIPGPGQTNWRYCKNCYAMFYDGFALKGRCPAAPGQEVILEQKSVFQGFGHQADGYNFALSHK